MAVRELNHSTVNTLCDVDDLEMGTLSYEQNPDQFIHNRRSHWSPLTQTHLEHASGCGPQLVLHALGLRTFSGQILNISVVGIDGDGL